MDKRIFTRFAALAVLAAATAFAADLTGTWTGEMKGPDGGGFNMKFHFKQAGAKLTGTVDGPGGDSLPISEGKVEGDRISFALKINRGGEGMKIVHDGTVKDDEITLNSKVEGVPGGGGPGPMGPITLKRSK